jgi:CDP-diacylglycerol--glycerol-3-phosphate 3-phosphatidyltransferase
MENQQDKYLEINNLPNRLTIIRMILVPVVIGCLFYASEEKGGLRAELGWAAAWIFTIASITDFLDGYFARKKGIVTIFGSFLDPMADKFLVVSSLIMLQALGRIHPLLVIISVLREMYVTSLRLLALNEGIQVPVENLGKWKTTFQMIGIPLLMGNERWMNLPIPEAGEICILISVFLSLLSSFNYSLGMIRKLKLNRLKKLKIKKLKKKKVSEANG